MTTMIDANTKCVVFGAEHANFQAAGAGAPFFASSIAGQCLPDSGHRAARHWLFDSVPVFKSAEEALERSGAQVAAILSAPDQAGDDIVACIEAGFALVVVLSEELHPEDRIRIKAALHGRQTKVIGPGSSGVVSPGRCHIGSLPHHFLRRGRVGIVSRCSRLARDVALQTTALGLGQSSIVDLGAQPVCEASLIDSLCAMMKDPATDAVVLIGGRDSRLEEEAATCLQALRGPKPVVAYFEGLSETADPFASEDEQVHQLSDAILDRKAAALRKAGAVLVESPEQIGQVVQSLVEAREQRYSTAPGASDFAAAMRQVEQHVYDAV